MQITCCGAAREVTGSCYYVENQSTRILIDCGLFQGSAFTEARNFDAFLFDPKSIQHVLITHAHLDHIGRLPKLVREGFKGKIYATRPTVDLIKYVLHDAFEIMEEEHRREYRPMLYGREDINVTLSHLVGIEYHNKKSFGDFKATWFDAGHIFGSAFIKLESKSATVIFSGDIGNVNVPILRETETMPACDLLFIESTYGNRIHEDESERVTKLRASILRTVKERGSLIIPAFAIERTQQLLYELRELIEHREIPQVDVYLDSPLAMDASSVIESYPEYYDKEAQEHIAKGEDMLSFRGLVKTRSRDESKTINSAPKPKIIIAGAGMMNGGRVQHHLIRSLDDPHSTVLIIGYQSHGTLGYKLFSGEKRVRVLDQDVEVQATVVNIGAMSAHGDQKKLLTWAMDEETPPSRIFCTHGDEGACVSLATLLEERLQVQAHAPRFGDRITMSAFKNKI